MLDHFIYLSLGLFWVCLTLYHAVFRACQLKIYMLSLDIGVGRAQLDFCCCNIMIQQRQCHTGSWNSCIYPHGWGLHVKAILPLPQPQIIMPARLDLIAIHPSCLHSSWKRKPQLFRRWENVSVDNGLATLWSSRLYSSILNLILPLHSPDLFAGWKVDLHQSADFLSIPAIHTV